RHRRTIVKIHQRFPSSCPTHPAHQLLMHPPSCLLLPSPMRPGWTLALLLTISPLLLAADEFPAECAPKSVGEGKPLTLQKIPRGEHVLRQPILEYTIHASGSVDGVHLKQRSGAPTIDADLLRNARHYKFNARPGCPAIEVEMGVDIDWIEQ